eukprot:364339-Chlamydomonas_euryale.AAC.3
MESAGSTVTSVMERETLHCGTVARFHAERAKTAASNAEGAAETVFITRRRAVLAKDVAFGEKEIPGLQSDGDGPCSPRRVGVWLVPAVY